MSSGLNLAPFIKGKPSTFNEASLFDSGALGSVYKSFDTTLIDTGDAPKYFQLVQLLATATAAVGAVVRWSDRDSFVVTEEGTATAANQNNVAGVIVNGSATAGNYIYIQVGGVGPVLVEAAVTPAVGDQLKPGDTTDGRAEPPAAGDAETHLTFAEAVSLKDAGSIGTDVVEAFLSPPRLGW